MKKLLQTEYIKYSRSTVFYVFIGLFAAFTVLSDVSSMYLFNKVGFKVDIQTAWSSLVYNAGGINFFLGLVILISITTEYQFRTFRQHIVDGLDRKDIFLAKYFYLILLSVFAAICVGITVLTVSLIMVHPGTDQTVMTGSLVLARYFVQVIGYMSIAMFFAFLFRATAVSVIVYVIYIPIESALGALCIYLFPNNAGIPKYFPKTMFANLVQTGFAQGIHAKTNMLTEGPSDNTTLVLSCVYIILLAAGSFWLLQKRDL